MDGCIYVLFVVLFMFECEEFVYYSVFYRSVLIYFVFVVDWYDDLLFYDWDCYVFEGSVFGK